MFLFFKMTEINQFFYPQKLWFCKEKYNTKVHDIAGMCHTFTCYKVMYSMLCPIYGWSCHFPSLAFNNLHSSRQRTPTFNLL